MYTPRPYYNVSCTLDLIFPRCLVLYAVSSSQVIASSRAKFQCEGMYSKKVAENRGTSITRRSSMLGSKSASWLFNLLVEFKSQDYLHEQLPLSSFFGRPGIRWRSESKFVIQVFCLSWFVQYSLSLPPLSTVKMHVRLRPLATKCGVETHLLVPAQQHTATDISPPRHSHTLIQIFH